MRILRVPGTRIGALLGLMAGSLGAANSYLVHNLVSDIPGFADHLDKNLVNPWGNGFSATSPFWIGNNGTGTSTLYDTTGTALALIVNIPSPSGGKGGVTGVISNSSTTAFPVAPGRAASFIFCTVNGTIAGWNNAVDATNAKTIVDNSAAGAVYTGCTSAAGSGGPLLFAANFKGGTIDVWDASFNAVKNAGAFTDPMVPSGFAPFNIQVIGGKLYVTYAKQSADKNVDVPGVGNGFVAVFDTAGALQGHLISQGPLNSPWGVAIAPATFGDFAGMLLVGNFGDGMIHAFDPATGALKGTLNDTKGAAITIQGLWSLMFGNGGRGGDPATLYITAGIPGPNGEKVESHGLFASIQAAPSFQSTGVVNSASFSSAITANGWTTIKGGGLSATTRSWQSADFSGNKLPTQLDGVSVTVNGEPAPISFISPAQINFLMPTDIPAGPVQVVVTNNGLTSATISATAQGAAPAFFIEGATDAAGNQFIAALHADNTLAGPPNLLTGITSTPFKMGEIAVLFGNGFGPTSPPAPNGVLLTTPAVLSPAPTILIGGQPAQVLFAGLSATGLFQFNVVIPQGLTLSGTDPQVDVPVVIQLGGPQTQSNAVISVARP